jgi:hypothetical protein
MLEGTPQRADGRLMKLALFAARLILLIARARALRLIRFRFFGLLRGFVFALGHCPLLIPLLISKGMLS